MRHCSVSACETFVPGPMIASAPPICPKSALSLLPLIRPPTTFPTTRIRDEKLDAFGVPGHHPSLSAHRGYCVSLAPGSSPVGRVAPIAPIGELLPSPTSEGKGRPSL